MGSRKQKILAVALIALVVIGAAAGAAFGYLSAQTGPVQNTFTPDQETNPAIVETFANNVKSDVKVDVGNPGYAVYVRAAIVVTWEDSNGNTYSQRPVASTDYRMQWNATDWFYNTTDGFFYHKAMVADNGTAGSSLTSVLIRECVQLQEGPLIQEDGTERYQLHVEIIAQTIQALGTTDGENPVPAITDAWGIAVNNDQKSADYQKLIDPNA